MNKTAPLCLVIEVCLCVQMSEDSSCYCSESLTFFCVEYTLKFIRQLFKV